MGLLDENKPMRRRLRRRVLDHLNSTLSEMLAALREGRFEEAQAAAAAEAAAPESEAESGSQVQDAEKEQLTLWSENKRPLPNIIARSALFGVVKRGKRRWFRRTELASWGSDSIEFTGERLDQGDEDVFLQLVHLHQLQQVNLGETVWFARHGFLKSLGRRTGGTAHDWFDRSVSRMVASEIRVRSGRLVYGGSLVNRYVEDEERGLWAVTLNPELVRLFAGDKYTRLSWEKRMLLTQDTSRWLQGRVESHSGVHFESAETLFKALYVADLEGLGHQKRRELRKDFRRKLRDRYFPELEAAGVVSSWRYIKERDVFEWKRSNRNLVAVSRR